MCDQSLSKIPATVSVPLGRQWTCCDAATSFLGRITAQFIALEQNTLEIIFPSASRNAILTLGRQVLDESASILGQLAKISCHTGCCIQIAVAVTSVATDFLNKLRALISSIDPSTIVISAVEILTRRFNNAITFIKQFIRCNCNCNEKKDTRRINFIVLDTSLGHAFVPGTDVRNIDNCCEAIIAAFEIYFTGVTFFTSPNLLTILSNLERLDELFFTNLRKLEQCKSCNCCIGAAEGLVDTVAGIINNSSILGNNTNFEVAFETASQGQNRILKIAC